MLSNKHLEMAQGAIRRRALSYSLTDLINVIGADSPPQWTESDLWGREVVMLRNSKEDTWITINMSYIADQLESPMEQPMHRIAEAMLKFKIFGRKSKTTSQHYFAFGEQMDNSSVDYVEVDLAQLLGKKEQTTSKPKAKK